MLATVFASLVPQEASAAIAVLEFIGGRCSGQTFRLQMVQLHPFLQKKLRSRPDGSSEEEPGGAVGSTAIGSPGKGYWQHPNIF